MVALALNERASNLLKILVTRYIRDGQPVGSRTLAKELDIALSPATIRNVMADLEELGLIFSPYTSAGRVPTVLGYRLFVDSLLQIQPVDHTEANHIKTELHAETDPNALLEHTSNMLSELTHLTSMVMLPRRDTQKLRRIEFLSLSDQRVLVILVFNEHEVHNRIIHVERGYSSSELEQAANYLNEAFAGKDVKAVRTQLLREMKETQHALDTMMQTAINMAEKAFDDDDETKMDFVIAGQTHLLNMADTSSIDKLRQLFDAFNQKRDVLHLLDQTLQARSMQIFIGEEAGYDVFEECSVITTPYTNDGQIIGVLGVIGPTRMAYERVIPIVDLTAKLLGEALKS